MALVSCSCCKRHVRDAVCPFCGAENTVSGQAPARPRAGMTRAALVLGAAVSVTGCVDSATPAYGAPPLEAGVDGGPVAVDAAYGGPPIDGGLDGGPIAVDAAYGGPPIDAGSDSGSDAGP